MEVIIKLGCSSKGLLRFVQLSEQRFTINVPTFVLDTQNTAYTKYSEPLQSFRQSSSELPNLRIEETEENVTISIRSSQPSCVLKSPGKV